MNETWGVLSSHMSTRPTGIQGCNSLITSNMSHCHCNTNNFESQHAIVKSCTQYKSCLRLLAKLSDIPPVSPLFGGYQRKLLWRGWWISVLWTKSFLVLADSHIFHLLLCSAEHHPLKRRQSLQPLSSIFLPCPASEAPWDCLPDFQCSKKIGHCTLQVFISLS